MSLYSAAVLLDTPDGYWRVGEASGNAADSSPNARTMTWGAGVSYGSTGALTQDADKAASFPGGASAVNKQLSLATTAFAYDGTTAFSFECWMNVPSTDTTTRRVCDRNPGIGGGAGYLFYITTAAGLIFVREVAGADVTVSTAAAGITGAWHYIAVTYDSANLRMYKDGALVSGPTADARSITATGSQTLSLGNEVGGTRPFNGLMDEIAIYPSALSAARVLAHYNAGKALRLPSPMRRGPRPISIPAGRAVYV